MKTSTNKESTQGDLSDAGRKLLKIIIKAVRENRIRAGRPETYLGYKESCDALEISTAEMEVPWGRLLQQHGLNDLNEWTIRHNLPRVSGLIVNQSGDRQYWPGVDFFVSNGRPDMDFDWWEDQVKSALGFGWEKFM